MKITFKDFLTENDAFTQAVADIQNEPFLKPQKDGKEKGIDKIQKVFDPVKWRKYLQYANAGNN